MSNALAIAAVTATLRKLIEDGVKSELPGVTVTAQSPDKANTTLNLVNLFLYQTSINGSLRNSDMPRQVSKGETAQPPLPLNLFYLVTAYGKDDDVLSPFSHRLLGRAMSVLHDHPVLSSADIKAALPVADLPLYDLYDQIERVRITPQPLALDELSKLFTAVQAKYRISTAYQAAVVLIESRRSSRTPLPVLRRGPEDRGADVQGDLTPPFPAITAISLPTTKQPSAQLGELLTIRGHHLDGDSVTVRFRHPRLDAPIDIGPLPGIATTEETELQVSLPDDAAARIAWAAGTITVSLVIARNADPVNKSRTTNEIAFALAPKILTRNPQTRSAAAGDFTLIVTCSPQVRPAQRATLLFGAREIAALPHPTQTGTVRFRIAPVTNALKGDHFLRLRIDGVDSLLVKYGQTPPVFDPNQKVTIT